MSSSDVIVPTGTANLASVLAAFSRLGVELAPASDAATVTGAHRVVLPGVGTFGAAMRRLGELGLVDALRRRAIDGMPTLAICVGMQVLSAESEESPAEVGLGVVPEPVRRFDAGMVVPQLAWSKVEPGAGSRFVEPGWAYFANSYRIESTPAGWIGTEANYGRPFVAAMEREGVLACQFHPELSGSWGAGLLRRWLGGTGS